MIKNSLVEKLEVWGFEEGLTIFKDGSLGFGFRLIPEDISCASDEKINQIKNQLKTFISSLPSEIDIQFVQSIERTGNCDLKEHLNYSKNASPLVRSMAADRYEKYLELDQDGVLLSQENFVFLRLPFKASKGTRIGLLNLNLKAIQDVNDIEFMQAFDQAKSLQNEIERNLSASGLTVNSVGPSEMIKGIFDTWNPNHPLGIGAYDETDIRNEVIVSELVKEVKGFRLGSTHHRVITLKVLPEQTFAGMAMALSNLPFGSKLFLSIHVPDQNKEIEWLKLNRRMAYAMVVGKKGVSDLESEAKLEDIENLLNEVVKDGEKILTVSLSIVLRSEDESDLDIQVSHVLQIIRELSGSEGFLETYAAFDVFTACSLPNARNKERSKRLKSSNVADLLPVFGLWKGFEKPSILMRTRAGSLFKMDSFSPQLISGNQIISGGSGSGKSYLANLLMGQMLSRNPRIFILDVGGSYQKTCELLDGQYIPLSMSSGISMNPFDLAVGEFLDDAKIKFLLTLVQVMTKEDEQKSIGKLEKAIIERAIQDVYTEQEKPRLSYLREKLENSDILEVKRIGKILSLWTGNSPYGKFFDRETTVSLEKRNICFDIKGLDANPDLQAAALFTIIDIIWRGVRKDRSEMKIIFLDECWRLFDIEAGVFLVAEFFRTLRKEFAQAIAISQTITDFSNSKAASAIMPNCPIKWILKQPGANFEQMAEVLRLNEREVSQIQSLTQVKGQFSEAFLICEDRRAVVSIEATPFEYWLATTDPKDNLVLQREKFETGKEGLSLIRYLAEKYPMGASQAARNEVNE